MGECSHCGEKESMPFKCKFCGELFCSEHRLPENHVCYGLEKFKKDRKKEPEKWIYGPFKARRDEVVGSGPKKPFDERALQFLQQLNTSKILYGILVLIILLTMLMTIR